MRLVLIGALLLCSCAGYQPPCSETPRNMRCMTGPELERALSEN